MTNGTKTDGTQTAADLLMNTIEQIIEIKPEWRNDSSERYFVVLEDRGNRVLAADLNAYGQFAIVPCELIATYMFDVIWTDPKQERKI